MDDKEYNRIANEHYQLLEWVHLLEAYIKTTSVGTMPSSNWGKLKQRLEAKRPAFLDQEQKPLG